MRPILNSKILLIILGFVAFSISTPTPLLSWSWNSADDVLPSLREELDREIASYRQQVGNGLSLQDRILYLDRLISNYKPLGLNVVDLETEQSRLILQEKQQRLRSTELKGEATLLYERGVAEYKEGQFQVALETFREAERLLPNDTSIKEGRRKLQGIVAIVESDTGKEPSSNLMRQAVVHYMENDIKRAYNCLVYAIERDKERLDYERILNYLETEHPEVDPIRLPSGISLVDHKLQLALEAIYDGRYLSAISECSDILDLEPNNVLALTRLGSAYFAMNEQNKARQVWSKALQLDPENDVLRKFLYGNKGVSRVEANQ